MKNEYNSGKPIRFNEAKSELELIDLLRTRYQMWAEDLDTLNGMLIGYHLAGKYTDTSNNLEGFREFLIHKLDLREHPFSWIKIIKSRVTNRRYEIPKFFEYLDEFRCLDIKVLGEVALSWEQRDYDFRRLLAIVNMDYPELPLKAPHYIKAVEIPRVRVHAFFYDDNKDKYYEQCLTSLDNLIKWAEECFNIPKEQWLLVR